MEDIRATITKRLEELDRKPVWLAEQVKTCHRTTIFKYLSGKTEINSSALREVLDILGIELQIREEPAGEFADQPADEPGNKPGESDAGEKKDA